jgi:hypothetical protein
MAQKGDDRQNRDRPRRQVEDGLPSAASDDAVLAFETTHVEWQWLC